MCDEGFRAYEYDRMKDELERTRERVKRLEEERTRLWEETQEAVVTQRILRQLADRLFPVRAE